MKHNDRLLCSVFLFCDESSFWEDRVNAVQELQLNAGASISAVIGWSEIGPANQNTTPTDDRSAASVYGQFLR